MMMMMMMMMIGLSKLIVLYDDNKITIDGSTDVSFTEDVQARFRSYGWQGKQCSYNMIILIHF